MKFVILMLNLIMSVATQSLLDLMKYWYLNNVNSMVKLVTDANLTHMFDEEGPYTVFAPNDDAIAQLPREVLERILDDKQFLIDLLKYHVVSGRLYSHQMSNDMTVPSLYRNGSKQVNIRFNFYPPRNLICADGAWLGARDNNATNGVLHIVDKVMYPFPLQNIPQLLTLQKGRFSTLLAAVKNTSSTQILEGGPFTLFAPTNKAFENMGYDMRNKLFANITALRDVLNYHLIGGTIWQTGFSYDDVVNTAYGRNVDVKNRYGGTKDPIGIFTVNDARVEEADIAVTNGVIHEIGAVLIPPDFKYLGIY